MYQKKHRRVPQKKEGRGLQQLSVHVRFMQSCASGHQKLQSMTRHNFRHRWRQALLKRTLMLKFKLPSLPGGLQLSMLLLEETVIFQGLACASARLPFKLSNSFPRHLSSRSGADMVAAKMALHVKAKLLSVISLLLDRLAAEHIL